MATDKYKVFEGTATTNDVSVQSSGADYTPTDGRMFIVRAVAFYNSNASAQTAYLKAGTTYILSNQVQSNKPALFDCCNAILLSGEKLYIKSDVQNDIKYRIWGVEIDM